VTAPAASRVERLAGAFERRFGRRPEGFADAPGRVNLIGEHLDYNLGWVLPIAIDRTVLVAFARRDDRRVRAYSVDLDEQRKFSLADIEAAPAGWSRYVAGVAWALKDAGYRLPGLDLALQGDVPVGAGLSSSAALQLAVAGAFRRAARLGIAVRELALLARRAENDFVGVACGIMDQFAAALSIDRHGLRIDCATLEVEHIPLPLEAAGVRVVIVDSAVQRDLLSSPYNERQRACAEALAIAKAELTERSIAGLAQLTDDDLQRIEPRLPPPLDRRARHVVSEQRRVCQAVEALRAGDMQALGELLWQSHASLRDDFEVSCRELDLLVELSSAVPGVLGARLTGAGFGGCTVHLVRGAALERFESEVVERYRAQTGLPAHSYSTTGHGGLRTWDA